MKKSDLGKFSKQYKNFYKSNIEEVLEAVPLFNYREGDIWYAEAYRFCSDVAYKYGRNPMTVAGVVAALSPLKSWDSNKAITHLYFQGVYKHTKSQIEKCHKILKAKNIKEIEKILGGEKTASFFLSINNPWSNDRIVIDRHMISLCGFHKEVVTKKEYLFLEECYKEVAEKHNINYNTLQAALWVYWRENK